jgi:hypothetical protein
MPEFRHKTLGTFKQREEFDEIRWETDLELAAFAAFSYMRNGKRRRSKKVPVAICSDDEPTKASIKILETIKRSQKQLVKNICTTFFDDLRQQGYDDSGRHEGHRMWWSRDPVTVALACREVLLKRLKRERMWEPEDLLVVLYEPRIEIFPTETDDGIPRTVIDFGAEFEDEHGVSVRTDGKRVLSLGYSGEA